MARLIHSLLHVAFVLVCAVRATRLMDSFMLPLQSIFAKAASLNSATIQFSTDWQVLGPFQIGTRGMAPDPHVTSV